MPRWRRRRLRRLKVAELKARGRVAPLISMRVWRDGVCVGRKRWSPPAPKLPAGVKVWTQEEVDRDGPPDGAFIMSVSFHYRANKCDLCGHVWQDPSPHPKDECDETRVRAVLKS